MAKPRTRRPLQITALKSVNPDRPRGPIQSKRCYALIRNAVAGARSLTVRLVEGQFIELVADISVEVSAKSALQPAAHEGIVIGSRVIGRTGCLRGLGRGACDQLLFRQRLQHRISRISNVDESVHSPR